MFTRIALSIAGLTGWRRYLLAFLLGLSSAAALPPVYALPLLLPAFMGLLWLLEGAERARQAWLTVWIFATGFFFAGLYWVGIAMTIEIEKFGWFMPFAVGGLSLGLSLFPASTVLIGWLLARRFDLGAPSRVLLFTLMWLLAEWLRSWVLSGFPWNQIGTVWAFSPLPLQAASIFGIWGLSAVTLFAASAPAMLAAREEAPLGRGLTILVSWLLVAALWAGGWARLADAPAPGSDDQDGILLRIVQASIDQKEKWVGDKRADHLRLQFEMTQAPGIEKVTHVIWPETAIPYFLSNTTQFEGLTSTLAPEGGLFISGVPRLLNPPEGVREAPRIFNSMVAVDRQGMIQGIFDKFHLVPFGEYVPLRSIVAMANLTVGSLDFTPGPGPRTLALPGLPPVSPLICYEVIFSGEVVDPAARPAWLLNLTNDAWFGDSSGPYQHFANARLRAVEEGLPLVRSANNGISAVVDAFGRPREVLGLNEVGIIDSPLPKPTRSPTIYSIIGNYWVLILFMVLSAATIGLRRVS